MEVRDLAWSDFADVTATYYAGYEEVQENPEFGMTLRATRPSMGDEAQWFATLYRKALEGKTVAVVAVDGGRTVGLCTVSPVSDIEEAGHRGLLGIHIARSHRDRGVGRALMTAALERCRGRFEQVELTVLRVNERGRHLYRSLGFRVYGERPRALRRGDRYLDEDLMVLDLSAGADRPG